MIKRNGKIARLPLEIRDTLNAFLSEGHTAEQILEWLNDEPDVLAILKAQFGRCPVSEHELSEWRSGGYEEWLASRASLANASAFTEKGECIAHSGIRAGHLLTVITAQWAALIQQWGTMDPAEFALAKCDLTDFTKSAIALRRIELQDSRSEMECARLKLLAEKKTAASSSKATAASESSSPESDSNAGGGAETAIASSPESKSKRAKQGARPQNAVPPASRAAEREETHPVASPAQASASEPPAIAAPPEPLGNENPDAAGEVTPEAGPEAVPSHLAPAPVPAFRNMRSRYGLR